MLLLIVLSQSYITSEWCGKELEHFVETHGDDRRKPREVIVVELRPFESFQGVPESIKNLRKELTLAQFWYQTADAPFPRLAGDPSPKEAGGAVYWLGRDKLLHALDSRLKEIRRLREMAMCQEPRAPETYRHTVPCAPAPVAVEDLPESCWQTSQTISYPSVTRSRSRWRRKDPRPARKRLRGPFGGRVCRGVCSRCPIEPALRATTVAHIGQDPQGRDDTLAPTAVRHSPRGRSPDPAMVRSRARSPT